MLQSLQWHLEGSKGVSTQQDEYEATASAKEQWGDRMVSLRMLHGALDMGASQQFSWTPSLRLGTVGAPRITVQQHQ